MRVFKQLFFYVRILLRYPLDRLKNNQIRFSTRLSSNIKISNSEIGSYCYIANNTNINNAIIGNYCSIAPSVQVGGMEHSYWWFSMSTFLSDKCVSNKKTIIEDDVWIAAGSIVKQGVKVGRGSVVGAMSFVNKDVPPNSVVMGVPAKIIRERINKEDFENLVKSRYWEYKPKYAKKIINNLK